MNDLKIFNNPEFGEIRVIEIEGEPWIVGKDVATALRYANPNEAIQDHVDDEDKLNSKTLLSLTDMDFGQRGAWLVNESGLYCLVLSSKLPNAKKFRRWVTHEVLPSIRKTGSYTIPNMSQEMKAILLLDTRTVQHEKRITALEDNMVIDYGQPRTLASQVNAVVMEALGGANAPAYCDKNVRGRAYSECNRDIQKWFIVNSRNNIPRKRFDEAVDYIKRWRPSTNMSMIIQQANRQTLIDR